MKSPKADTNVLREEVNLLLASISIEYKRRSDLQDQSAAKVAEIHKQYAPEIERESRHIAEMENDLEKLVKKHREQIMGNGDRADLRSGSVMLKTVTRVHRIKDMLDRLMKAGWNIAIKRPKPVVDWDQVEKFDDATLEKLGTTRKSKVVFAYELKRGGQIDG